MSEQVPEGWEMKKLGDIASIVMGQSPDSKTYNDKREGLPFFQGKADFGARSPTVRLWCSVPSKVTPENSILFSVRAPVGDINSFNEKCCIGRGLAGIQANNSDQEFLYQSLLFLKSKFEALGQGSTFEAINGGELKSFHLHLPPLPEQKKIASILTSVDEVIEKTQSQIDKLQDLKKGTMNELLTKGIGHTEFKDSELGRIPKSWEVGIVSDLGKVVTGSTPNTTNRELYDGDFMFVSPSDISEEMFVEGTDKTVTLEGLKTIREIPLNSVMIVCIGSTIGKVALNTDRCATNQQINTIVPENADPFFIYFLMKMMANLIRKESGTQAVPLINKTDFSNIMIKKPPIDEQRVIGRYLSSFNSAILKKTNKLHQTQSLKKSLMHDLLTGKVRVSVN